MQNKTNLLLFFTLVIFVLRPVPVMATPEAQTFVTEKVAMVLNTLSDPALNSTQKTTQFHQQIQQVADISVIARFVLGAYAAKASVQELDTFTNAFRSYALSIYQTELGQYGREVLQVHRSLDRHPGDCVVITTLSGGSITKPQNVKWRVLTIKGQPRVVDIEVSGVWISQNQRSDITSLIKRNGGDIDAASQALKERTR